MNDHARPSATTLHSATERSDRPEKTTQTSLPTRPVPSVERARKLAAERDTLEDVLKVLAEEKIADFAAAPSALRAPLAPSIHYAEDHDSVAPGDRGKDWLERATESEQSGAPAPSSAPISALSLEEIADLGPAPDPSSDPLFERDTEPSLDVTLARAAHAAGKV